ncbi:PilC/PilY family type IV pilus protein, partial [Mycolicibacterium poriferae]|uniref:PilC/PilY family type IV pilus protein n=1 Tax=Mycolicibacterium poriferae TaxID=39694 RepID=UPI0024BB794E
MNIVDNAVTVVVDTVAGDLTGVGPHIVDQVRVVVVHSGIDDGYQDVVRTGGLGPGFRGVDVGVAFTTGNWKSLSAGQRSSLNDGGSDDDGKDLLNWLRGDKSKEGTSFRTREGLLGDIVNSDPFFVGTSEDYGYSVLGGDEGTKYSAYLQAKAARSPMIYVGANDGMLHGFDAETGKESFAVVLSSLYSDFADLADVDYDHQYFV